MGTVIPSNVHHIQGFLYAYRRPVEDWKHLRALQRQALITITTAYKTVSLDGINVVAGAVPIQLVIDERCVRYNLRIGKQATLGNVTVQPDAEDRLVTLRTETIRRWQEQWDTTENGRETKVFFPDVEERLTSS